MEQEWWYEMCDDCDGVVKTNDQDCPEHEFCNC